MMALRFVEFIVEKTTGKRPLPFVTIRSIPTKSKQPVTDTTLTPLTFPQRFPGSCTAASSLLPCQWPNLRDRCPPNIRRYTNPHPHPTMFRAMRRWLLQLINLYLAFRIQMRILNMLMGNQSLLAGVTFPGFLSTSGMTKTHPSPSVLSSWAL